MEEENELGGPLLIGRLVFGGPSSTIDTKISVSFSPRDEGFARREKRIEIFSSNRIVPWHA